jgi:DNA-directed RNA polymerase specialized sigma24 family protein
MLGTERWDWIKRQTHALARTIEKTYTANALLESADDIVQHVLMRLLRDPTGEYAPKPDDRTPEVYVRRCIELRVSAIARAARAKKRTFQGPNHGQLVTSGSGGNAEGGSTDVCSEEPSPEQIVVDTDGLRSAQHAILEILKDSRITGITYEYAIHILAMKDCDTEQIADNLNTTVENIRNSRRRLLAYLRRKGLIDPALLRDKDDAEQ